MPQYLGLICRHVFKVINFTTHFPKTQITQFLDQRWAKTASEIALGSPGICMRVLSPCHDTNERTNEDSEHTGKVMAKRSLDALYYSIIDQVINVREKRNSFLNILKT